VTIRDASRLRRLLQQYERALRLEDESTEVQREPVCTRVTRTSEALHAYFVAAGQYERALRLEDESTEVQREPVCTRVTRTSEALHAYFVAAGDDGDE